jgi:serine/threonine-protein kinase HipA
LQKYEKEGGPSFKQCADLLREHSSLPALEIDKLLQWALFNLLAGNSDAHGKNLSILYGKDGTISLAPFYDLVCTRNYERLDRHLAMSIGGEADPGLVGGDHVTRFAADLQVNPSLIFETLDNMLKAIPQALETATEEFNAEWGDSPILERLPIVQ